MRLFLPPFNKGRDYSLFKEKIQMPYSVVNAFSDVNGMNRVQGFSSKECIFPTSTRGVGGISICCGVQVVSTSPVACQGEGGQVVAWRLGLIPPTPLPAKGGNGWLEFGAR